MAGHQKTSKNNPGSRNKGPSHGYKRTGSDKVVFPTLYVGKHAGHGSYMAAQIDGEMVLDADGVPLMYRDLDKTRLSKL